MLRFWIYHSFQYVRVAQGSKYVWITPGYVWLCLNVPKFVWMAFALHSSIVIPYLKETLTIFLESKNFIFSIVPGSNWFCFFVFRLNTFTSKFSNLLLPLGAELAGGFVSYATSEIPNQYIYDAFLMTYSHFLALQKS